LIALLRKERTGGERIGESVCVNVPFVFEEGSLRDIGDDE